jgi:nitroreductase
MEFHEVLEKRHSCRDFEEKVIEEEKLQRIIKAVMSAPSAGDLQAYRIYVVKGKEKKEDIARAALDQGFLAGAPVVLVFCADKNESAAKYGDRGMELYALQDATIAAAYSQLAAEAEGISSVWVGAFEPLEVSYVVDAPAGVVPVALVPLGYRKGSPRLTPRKPQEEIVQEV